MNHTFAVKIVEAVQKLTNDNRNVCFVENARLELDIKALRQSQGGSHISPHSQDQDMSRRQGIPSLNV